MLANPRPKAQAGLRSEKPDSDPDHEQGDRSASARRRLTAPVDADAQTQVDDGEPLARANSFRRRSSVSSSLPGLRRRTPAGNRNAIPP
jgi:hypothetical protein